MPAREASDYLFGFSTIRSELPLNLPAARAPVAQPDFTLGLASSAAVDTSDTRLLREVIAAEGAEPWLRIFEGSAGFRFRFPSIAEFRVTTDGRRIDAFALERGNAADLSHLFLHQVLPLLLSATDLLVMHASAVSIQGEAVAFLGESGQGKSTIAADFHRRGLPMITDDCLLVRREAEGFRAYGNSAEVRLWQDSSAAALDWEGAHYNPQVSYTAKKSVHPPDASAEVAVTQGVPIRGLYVLGEEPLTGGAIAILPLTGKEACMAVVRSLFRMSTEGAREATRLDDIADLVSSVPVYLLEYPRRSELLPALFRAISE